MGRTARNYPKGRLKLRTPRVVQSNKRYPIYIEYNWNADSMRKTTEVSVFPKDWNEKDIIVGKRKETRVQIEPRDKHSLVVKCAIIE